MVKALSAHGKKFEGFKDKEKEEWLKANSHFFNRYPAGAPRGLARNGAALKAMILAGAVAADIIRILETQLKSDYHKVVDWISVQPEWVTLQAKKASPTHEADTVKVEVINATIRNSGKYKVDCEHCAGHGLRYKENLFQIGKDELVECGCWEAKP